MQSISSKIWTRVAMSISYDDNHYITGTSLYRWVYTSRKCRWHILSWSDLIYDNSSFHYNVPSPFHSLSLSFSWSLSLSLCLSVCLSLSLSIYIYIYILRTELWDSLNDMWNAALCDVAFPGHWAGTHFGWLCSQVHESSWVCLGSGGSGSRPSDRDSGKLVFVSHALRRAFLKPQGAVLPGFNPLRRG